MGSTEGDSDEQPVHTVYLNEYRIDKYETRVTDYRQCVEAGKCDIPFDKSDNSHCNWGYTDRDNYPINCVDWFNAKKYCEYAGKRLPAEAEWERAATWKNGTKYKYPNGKSSIDCQDAVIEDGGKGCGKNRTWLVGSKREEINGTYDMVGNVAEWVSDWYDSGYYGKSPSHNPQGPQSGSYRVYRGGSWRFGAWLSRGAIRYCGVTHRWSNDLGFRCVSP